MNWAIIRIQRFGWPRSTKIATCPSKHLSIRDARTREQIPEAFTWNLADIYPSWNEWEAGLSEFEAKACRVRRAAGNARAGSRPTAQGAAPGRRSRANCRTSSGTTPASPTTRISGTTPPTPGGSVCRFSSPRRRRRSRGSLLSSCGFRSRPCVAGCRPIPTLRHTASPSRGCTTSRSTSWMKKGSICCRCRTDSATRRTTFTRCWRTPTSSTPSLRCTTGQRRR